MPYYISATALGVLSAAVFLLNSDAGPNWARVGLPLDDTWIHLIYARNLAQLGGFHYNPGMPAAGMSSPLWVILLAMPLRIGVDPAIAAKSLSLFFGILTSIAAYHLGLQACGSMAAAWIAGLITSLEPNLAFSRVSGMEVTLLAFLLTLSLLLLMDRKYTGFGIVLGLATVTRGEAAVFGIVTGGILLLSVYLRRGQLAIATWEEAKLGARLFIPAIILGGAWTLFNLSVSGMPLPNTYYVKHHFGLGWFNPISLVGIWQGYLRHAALGTSWLAAPTGLLVALGAVMLIKIWGARGIPIALGPWLFVYSLSLNFMLSTNQWNFAGRRHLDFIWPILSVSIAAGAVWMWNRVRISNSRWGMLVLPLAVLGYGFFAVVTGADRFRDLANEYSWNCRNIEEISVAMGRWLDRNLPEGTTIGVTDAGAIRFFGNRETIDLLGLNLHEVIGRRLDELILEYRPDYAILFRSEEIDSWDFLEEIYNLTPERNTILGGYDLVVYRFVGGG